MLNPAARVLWRAADQVQLELGTRAMVLDGVDYDAMAYLIGRSHGPQTAPSPTLQSALPALGAAGFLVRADDPESVRRPAPRLAAQLTALRSRHGAAADALIAARQASTVTVQGNGWLAAPIGAALAAAGVGRVCFTGSGDVHLYQCLPGGVPPSDEGRRFALAASAAVRRAAPECDSRSSGLDTSPDLVVLAGEGPIDPELRESLHSARSVHLVAAAGCEVGRVGPLVLPGLTSCLRCADLNRTERDPAWPALAVQLARPERNGGGADAPLAVLIAGLTAVQALSYLDGVQPATVGGTLELHLPDWRLRRRTWPPHPGCDCGAYPASVLPAP